MARRLFFSFHYDRDIRRVVQVRNSWVVRLRGETQPFLDKADWEKIRRAGSSEIKRWIEKQLSGTSVTVVLIGAETAEREWVGYEIKRSLELGKGLLGIRIHNIKDPQTGTDYWGANPFDSWSVNRNGRDVKVSSFVSVYDWIADDGYNNVSSWIEDAAANAGR